MPSTLAVMPLLLAGLALGCGELKDLLVLQQGLAHEFQTSRINVNLSSNQLAVVFQNSSAADLPEAQRAAFAQHVAEYVRDHYPAYDRLESVAVGFATVRGGGGFTVSNTNVPYRFATSDLGAGRAHKAEQASAQVK